MNTRTAAIIGSGTIPYTRGILPVSQRGNEPLGEGVRTGTQVLVANFEDNTSVDAFGIRNVTVGVSATLIVGPNDNPLPRQRSVIIRNEGADDVFIGPASSVTTGTGFPISSSGQVEIPLLNNVEVWGIAAASRDVRVLIY
jgi:hypothetical protein